MEWLFLYFGIGLGIGIMYIEDMYDKDDYHWSIIMIFSMLFGGIAYLFYKYNEYKKEK